MPDLLHVERSDGPGTPVVLLHGFGGDLSTWDDLARRIAGTRPLIRPDLRGHGRSPPLDEQPYDHGEDLVALLDRLALDHVDLCGLSLGGAVALNAALRWPARVRRLVLVSPAMVGWEWSDDWRARWRQVAALARAGDMAAARDAWWRHPLFDPVRETAAGVAQRAAIGRFAGQHWLHDPHVRQLPDVERLHELAIPTLLLAGTRDLPDFRLIADLIAAAAPAVERVDFAEAGHLLHVEQPEHTAAAIARFLDDSRAPAQAGA